MDIEGLGVDKERDGLGNCPLPHRARTTSSHILIYRGADNAIL